MPAGNRQAERVQALVHMVSGGRRNSGPEQRRDKAVGNDLCS